MTRTAARARERDWQAAATRVGAMETEEAAMAAMVLEQMARYPKAERGKTTYSDRIFQPIGSFERKRQKSDCFSWVTNIK